MNRRIPLNGSDRLFKDFYGEDWRWRSSHLPDSRDRRGWRIGSIPGCPNHDVWRLWYAWRRIHLFHQQLCLDRHAACEI